MASIGQKHWISLDESGALCIPRPDNLSAGRVGCILTGDRLDRTVSQVNLLYGRSGTRQDHPSGVPGCAQTIRSGTQVFWKAARNVDTFELAVGKKTDVATVRGPEKEHRGILCALEWPCDFRVERS